MKQVHKQYQQAFLLEPTKLGRIVDTIHQRLADHPNATTHDAFEVFLVGNRREDLTSVDAVLAIDNSRRHRITRLLITCTAATPGAPKPEHEVQVDFAAPKQSSGPTTTKVVTIDVRSGAPGWASRTLSEVEEQVERTWLHLAWPTIVLFLLFPVGLILLASQFVYVPREARPTFMWLEETDMPRVQALLAPNHTLTEPELREIATMQLRNVVRAQSPPPARSAAASKLFLVIPTVVVLGCVVALLTTCYSGSVFLWGDGVDRYNRALQRRRALWGVIIGVVVVGVLSNSLFKWLAT